MRFCRALGLLLRLFSFLVNYCWVGGCNNFKLLEKTRNFFAVYAKHLDRVIYSIFGGVYSKSVFTFKTQSSSKNFTKNKTAYNFVKFRHFKLVGLKDILTNIEAIFSARTSEFSSLLFCFTVYLLMNLDII